MEWGKDPDEFRALPAKTKAEMTAFIQIKQAGEGYFYSNTKKDIDETKTEIKKTKTKYKYPRQR